MSQHYHIFIDFGDEHLSLEHEGTLKSALQEAYKKSAEKRRRPHDIRISGAKPRIGHSPDDGWQTVSPVTKV